MQKTQPFKKRKTGNRSVFMYSEDELLPLSALQHLIYCPRQCALIHIEQLWVENRYTAEGRIMHERVHSDSHETRGRVRIVRGLPLRSFRLGLVGQADVVEFHKIDKNDQSAWQPRPVEYKRGRPKKDSCDLVQICGQAMCLEEMLGCSIDYGYLYYGKTKRRLLVEFNEDLREQTEQTALKLHELISSGQTPHAQYSSKCERCSLLSMCMPQICTSHKSASKYLKKVLIDSLT